MFLPVPPRVSQVFQEMWKSSGKTARQIILEKDLGLVSDAAQLHGICQKVVDSHPDEVRPAHTFCIYLLYVLWLSITFATIFRPFKMLCCFYVSVGSRHPGREPESFEQADGPGSERDQRQSWPRLSEGHSHREDFQETHLERRKTSSLGWCKCWLSAIRGVCDICCK